MNRNKHPRTKQRSKALRRRDDYSYCSVLNLEDYGLRDRLLLRI